MYAVKERNKEGQCGRQEDGKGEGGESTGEVGRGQKGGEGDRDIKKKRVPTHGL